MDVKVLLERLTEIEQDLNNLCFINSTTVESKINNIKDIIKNETGNSLIFTLGENQSRLIDDFDEYKYKIKSVSVVRLKSIQLIQDIKKINDIH